MLVKQLNTLHAPEIIAKTEKKKKFKLLSAVFALQQCKYHVDLLELNVFL
jgi:hypothetical protein